MNFPPQIAMAIEDLSKQIAQGVDEANHAAGAVRAAEQPRDHIAGRLSELASQRAEITGRRQSGHASASDGENLVLIAADSEGLSEMMPEAVAKVAAAQAIYDAASGHAARLRTQLQQTEAIGTHGVLMSHATELCAKLSSTIVEMENSARTAGITGRHPWCPPQDLYLKLRQFAAAHGGL